MSGSDSLLLEPLMYWKNEKNTNYVAVLRAC